MYKRFGSLRFIIGLFFFLLAVILLAGYVFSEVQRQALNLLTGLGFLVFSIAMMWETRKGEAG